MGGTGAGSNRLASRHNQDRGSAVAGSGQARPPPCRWDRQGAGTRAARPAGMGGGESASFPPNLVTASPPWWRALSQNGLRPRPTSTPASPCPSLCPSFSVTSVRRPALTVRTMLHFCAFKTGKGIALGTVHLTGHAQQTGFCWASVPNVFSLFSCLARTPPPAAGPTQRNAAGSRGAEAAHPFVGPCQPGPLPGAGRLPSHRASPFLPGQAALSAPSCCALCSQLLLPRNNCELHQPRGCFLV